MAERLYRATGEGIYADSVTLGRRPPIAEPLVNAEVAGQDSTQRVIYRGKVYWFWGDIEPAGVPARALRHGRGDERPARGRQVVAGRRNRLPLLRRQGRLPPTAVRAGGALLHWAEGMFVLKDTDGRERLLATVSVRKSLEVEVARRLVEFDDDRGLFRTIRELPMTSSLKPSAMTFTATRDGKPHARDGKPHAPRRQAARSRRQAARLLAADARRPRSGRRGQRDRPVRGVHLRSRGPDDRRPGREARP